MRQGEHIYIYTKHILFFTSNNQVTSNTNRQSRNDTSSKSFPSLRVAISVPSDTRSHFGSHVSFNLFQALSFLPSQCSKSEIVPSFSTFPFPSFSFLSQVFLFFFLIFPSSCETLNYSFIPRHDHPSRHSDDHPLFSWKPSIVSFILFLPLEIFEKK